MKISSIIQNRLAKSPPLFFLWASIATFGAYFCMYMYRKPYTAAIFDGELLFGIDYKILLITTQVCGYAMSKFIGIKVISSMGSHQRVVYYLCLIGLAHIALTVFAYSSSFIGLICFFVNGLALGMIWGVVFQYLEGRSITEMLTVILSANFIITSGISKSIGQTVMMNDISAKMMPMIIGWAFLPACVLFIWMLSVLPPQNNQDKTERNPRKPMTNDERKSIIKNYGILIVLFILGYIMMTIIRDVRDNFGVEIWQELGYANDASIYTTTELPATLFLLLLLGFLYKIKDNSRALKINLWLTIAGLILLVVSTFGYSVGYISGKLWMMIAGVGLFVPYILFNGILFDRLIGAMRINANVGFFMYIVDAFGYLGSVFVMMYKNFGNAHISWLQFFKILTLGAGGIGIIIMILTFIMVQHSLFKIDSQTPYNSKIVHQ